MIRWPAILIDMNQTEVVGHSGDIRAARHDAVKFSAFRSLVSTFSTCERSELQADATVTITHATPGRRLPRETGGGRIGVMTAYEDVDGLRSGRWRTGGTRR